MSIPRYLIMNNLTTIVKRFKPFWGDPGWEYSNIVYTYCLKNPTWAPGSIVYKLDRRTVPKRFRNLIGGVYQSTTTHILEIGDDNA